MTTTTTIRRRQTTRGAATRRVLLDSCIQCLVERGYSGTSTTAICAAAGLTAGALFGQFPNKTSLLVELAEDGVAKARPLVAAAFDDLPPQLDDALMLAFDRLIEVWRQPVLRALTELWTAARTEPELARALLAARYDGPNAVWEKGTHAPPLMPARASELAEVVILCVAGQSTVNSARITAGSDLGAEEIASVRATLGAIGRALQPS